MPRIPLSRNTPSVQGLPNAPLASAEAFGASQGHAIQALGAAGARVAGELREYQHRQDTVAAADAHARLMRDFGPQYLKLQQSQPEGMKGFGELVATEFDKYAETHIAGESDGVRRMLKAKLADTRLHFAMQATEAEAKSTAAMTRHKAEGAMSASLATIAMNPRGSFAIAERDTAALLESLPMSGDQRAALKRDWDAKAADAYFGGLIQSARGPGDFAALRREMASPEWIKRIDAKDVLRLQQHMLAAEKAAAHEADQRAGAAIQMVEGRMMAGLPVSPEEIAQAESFVKQSRNPMHATRFAEINITNRTRRDAAGLPAPQLDAMIAQIQSGHKPVTASPETTAGLRDVIKREPTPPELYLASVVEKALPQSAASSTAAVLAALAETPDAPISSVAPGLGKEGQTVAQFVADTTKSYATGVGQRDFIVLQALKAQRAEIAAATGPGGDVMTYAARAGKLPGGELLPITDAASAARRGAQALELQRVHQSEHPQPLTASEVAQFKRVFEAGQPAEVAALMLRLQEMGPEASRGAIRQLGEKAPVFAHVAGLAASGPAGFATAEDVIRGRRRLEEDKAGAKARFADLEHNSTATVFDTIVGQSLDGLEPSRRQAIREAADALYVQMTPTGQAFDQRQYASAISLVLGGRGRVSGGLKDRLLGAEADGLAAINGKPTVLPPGIDGTTFSSALRGLTETDLTQLSTTGRPPVDAAGVAIPPGRVARDAEFRALGAGQYLVIMPDGRPPAAGVDPRTGKVAPYIMKLTPQTLRRLRQDHERGPAPEPERERTPVEQFMLDFRAIP